jgi:hypothetical protein
VLIRGEEDHCPHDFYQRLCAYSFDEIFQKNGFAKKHAPLSIELPLDDIEDDNLDKAFLRLKESYCTQNNWGVRLGNQEWQLTPQMPDNDFLIIHHELGQAEWSSEWDKFWQFYINDWGKKLATQFSSKLIVVTTCTAFNENAGFVDCFEKLGAVADNHVAVLTQFDKVTYRDISTWQLDVFKSAEFNSEEIVGKDNSEGITFLEAKKSLRGWIATYLKIKANLGLAG